MTSRLLILILTIATLCPAAAASPDGSRLPGLAVGLQNPVDTTSRREYPVMDYRSHRQYIIDSVDIRIKGSFLNDPVHMAEQAGIFIGDTINVPGPYITAAINKLVARQQFSYVDIVAEPIDDERANIVIYLESTPRVSEWKFEGIRKGQATTLTTNMKLKQAQSLSDYDINKHKNYIKEHYKEKGFRNAEVDVRIENDERYPQSNLVIVTFIVDTKQKVKIGDITFSGNNEFSDNRLRRAFKKTHKKSWNIFQSAKLKDKEYEEDRDINLIDFYNSKGFRNAFVLGDSIYNISDNRLGIHVDLSEGNKYYFRNISFIGNSIYPTEILEMILGLKKGDTYDKKTLEKRLGVGAGANPNENPDTIDALYKNKGYLAASIEPAEIIVGRDSIDLEVKIFQGNQFSINKVNISGNEAVDTEVIQRDVYIMPGELYNQELLMMTMRRLATMGHFEETSVMPNIQPVSDRLVDISYSLVEKASDQFEISGGWGAGMFIGSVGININNLSTRRMFNGGAWRPYPRGQNQSLSIRAQSNGQYYKAFSLSFMEPWLGGKKPISLSVGTHYSDETNAYYFWQSTDEHFRTLGVSAGIGQRLSWPDPNFTLYNDISYTAYILENWDYFQIMTNGVSNIIALNTTLARSTLNSDIFPSSGSNISLSLSLTPPFSLFDGKDYSDPKMKQEDRYKWIEYHKWKFKGDWYTSLSANNKFVFRAAVELGYLGHYNKNKLSPFEGFDVGGSGMSGYNVYGVDVIGLRGYDDGALTPTSSGAGNFARVYNKYTAELRYLIINQPGTAQIYGLAFAEGGNAYRDWKEFNPFQIKRALGVGVKIQLPMVGMIGFDWGWGFDAQVGETKRHGSQVTFTFGNQF